MAKESEKMTFNGETIEFDRAANCDYCGQKRKVAIAHYGTTNYNRFICKDCIEQIKKYHKQMFNQDI